MAFPSIALNLFSSYRIQDLGVFQYRAVIVPVLIFATIEAMVLITWIVQLLVKQLRAPQEQQTRDQEASPAEQMKPAVFVHPGLRWLQPAVLLVLVGFTLFT